MSGAATAQWKIPTHQMDLFEKQAKILNCDDESIDKVMRCLKQVIL